MKCLIPEHNNKDIVYVCCTSEWHTEPLCMECIPTHNETHLKNRTQSNIKLIQKAQEECLNKISKATENFHNQKQILLVKKNEKIQESTLSIIQQAKHKLINMIDQFFDKIQNDYIHMMKPIEMNRSNELDVLIFKIDRALSDMNTYKANLENSDIIKGLKFTLLRDFDQELKYINDKYQDIHESYISLIDLSINDIRLTSIESYLDTIYSLKKTLKQIEKQQPNIVLNNNSSKTKSEIRDKSEKSGGVSNAKSNYTTTTKPSSLLQSKIKNNTDNFLIRKTNLVEKEQLSQFLPTNSAPSNSNKKHTCDKCGEQMSFVSNFKKHLTCLNCYNVKRLYEKPNKN